MGGGGKTFKTVMFLKTNRGNYTLFLCHPGANSLVCLLSLINHQIMFVFFISLHSKSQFDHLEVPNGQNISTCVEH